MDFDKFIVDRDTYQSCEDNVKQDILSDIFNPNLIPDFMIIGAPRSGTTFLSEIIKQVSNAFVAEHKELKFFSSNILNFDYRSYLNQFIGGIGQVKGEATPSYASLPLSRIRLIYDMNPQLKLIYILREPRKRLASDWKHTFRNRENCTESEILSYVLSDGPVVASDYAENLSRWLTVFPKEQFLILFYDDLQIDVNTFLDRVMQFLGLSVNLDLLHIERINHTWEDSYIQETIDRIYPALFTPRIRKLGEFLNTIFLDIDLPGWLEFDTSINTNNVALAYDLCDDKSIFVVDGYYICGSKQIIREFKHLKDVIAFKQQGVGYGYYLVEAISSAILNNNVVDNRLYALCHGDKHHHDLLLLRESYFGWNIVFYRDKFFSARVDLGHFDLRTISSDQLKLFQQQGDIVIFNSLQDALIALNNK
ncbi:sulfotransferase domain-containing protein [Methylobacter sp. S3L5C]|uniref:sulfotransferase domain-containing protein n=1 Tax=Methylobacter sp. S3L5C TaxID=2839024 RepID=UPI001FAB7392|nr:sulfotransferase domain-containing protein [Methylobacter sp. S3L5C]UOA07594.1 sulfotransferase domain-containing protein [Methylobacter sp. S3L5C]